jgi:hypothetical protein
MPDDGGSRPLFSSEELQRIARDWNAVIAAQQSLSLAVANMTDHLPRLVDAAQRPVGPPASE